MDYILGAALGGLTAFAYSVPAIVLELIERGTVPVVPPVLTVHTILGFRLKKQEAFWVGLLLHMLIGMLVGGVYILFVDQGWLFVTRHPYKFDSFFVYGFLSWIVVNSTIYPALQMGWFGKKEGRAIWLETLISHMLIAVTLAGLVQWFQPWFFMGKI